MTDDDVPTLDLGHDFDPTYIPLRHDPLRKRFSGVARHGYVEFDVPFISHIDGNLYVGGCEDDLILPEHIEHVISLYRWETYQYHRNVKSTLTVKMYDDDTGVPAEQVYSIAKWAEQCLLDGPTLIHCQAGLNRSNLVAAVTLMYANSLTAREAIDLLREKRSDAVLCNRTFEEWVLSHDDD